MFYYYSENSANEREKNIFYLLIKILLNNYCAFISTRTAGYFTEVS